MRFSVVRARGAFPRGIYTSLTRRTLSLALFLFLSLVPRFSRGPLRSIYRKGERGIFELIIPARCAITTFRRKVERIGARETYSFISLARRTPLRAIDHEERVTRYLCLYLLLFRLSFSLFIQFALCQPSSAYRRRFCTEKALLFSKRRFL